MRLFPDRGCGRGRRPPGSNGRLRQILPGIYRGLTIKVQVPDIGGPTFFRLGPIAMRIYGSNGAGLAAKPNAARRAASGGFSVSEPETPHNTPATTSLRAVSSLDSLMALQGIESPTERKKRAVVKGRRALDVLDDLKLGMLDGSLDSSTIARLKVAADGLSEGTGDPGLDAVMGEIDLRVAVEIAKASVRQA
jgi:hypothetical protein